MVVLDIDDGKVGGQVWFGLGCLGGARRSSTPLIPILDILDMSRMSVARCPLPAPSPSPSKPKPVSLPKDGANHLSEFLLKPYVIGSMQYTICSNLHPLYFLFF